MNDGPKPVIGRGVYIAATSYVGGEVTIGDRTTIMHFVMIRGDIAPIRIGARVNIQDGAVVHTAQDQPLIIGDDVGIGHRAVVHCTRVGRRTLIGIGSILLDECEIGCECLIAAGTILAPNTVVPDRTVVMGAPGKPVREVTDRDLETIDHVVSSYLRLGRLHAAGRYPNIVGS